MSNNPAEKKARTNSIYSYQQETRENAFDKTEMLRL